MANLRDLSTMIIARLSRAYFGINCINNEAT